MALDKAIESGKEHRKPYRKAQAVDRSCRNHGSCPYCESNRTHKHRAQEYYARRDMEEYMRKDDM